MVKCCLVVRFHWFRNALSVSRRHSVKWHVSDIFQCARSRSAAASLTQEELNAVTATKGRRSFPPAGGLKSSMQAPECIWQDCYKWKIYNTCSLLKSFWCTQNKPTFLLFVLALVPPSLHKRKSWFRLFSFVVPRCFELPNAIRSAFRNLLKAIISLSLCTSLCALSVLCALNNPFLCVRV